jgi:hypothetical protein
MYVKLVMMSTFHSIYTDTFTMCNFFNSTFQADDILQVYDI